MGFWAAHCGMQLQGLRKTHFPFFYNKYLLYFPIDGKEIQFVRSNTQDSENASLVCPRQTAGTAAESHHQCQLSL